MKKYKILALIIFTIIVVILLLLFFSNKQSNVAILKAKSVLAGNFKIIINLSENNKTNDTTKTEYRDLLQAEKKNSIESYQFFLTKYPNSEYYNAILSKIINLESEFSVRKMDSIFVNSEDDIDPFSGYKSSFLYFTDNRDEQTYKVVKIGKNYWFAENLRFKPEDGNYWAYNNNDSMVSKYGYLYDWQTANEVCPKGWHLSSDEDWNILEEYCGGRVVAGNMLKSKSGWYKYNSGGKNNLGFSAIASGYRSEKGDFQNIRKVGGWWTSSQINGISAWNRNLLFENSSVYQNKVNKNSGYSVRCVK